MNNYGKTLPNRRSIRLKEYDYSKAGAYFITICCDGRKCHFGKIIVGAGFTPARDENDGAGFTPARNQNDGTSNRSTARVDPTARMELNEFGTIAYNEWNKLPERFANVELDEFQIMPNHMHGIIVLTTVGAGLAPALNNNDSEIKRAGANPVINNDGMVIKRAGVSPAPTGNATIGDIVGAYKSLVAKGCLDIFKHKWQGTTPAPSMGKLWQRNYYEHIIRDEKSYYNIAKYIVNNPKNWMEDKFHAS